MQKVIMAGIESVKNAMKYGRHVTIRDKAHVNVSNSRVKNESHGRYTIGDIFMFWHAILKRTLQEQRNSAWCMLHIMKQNRKNKTLV